VSRTSYVLLTVGDDYRPVHPRRCRQVKKGIQLRTYTPYTNRGKKEQRKTQIPTTGKKKFKLGPTIPPLSLAWNSLPPTSNVANEYPLKFHYTSLCLPPKQVDNTLRRGLLRTGRLQLVVPGVLLSGFVDGYIVRVHTWLWKH
jgi:hypothetical protein